MSQTEKPLGIKAYGSIAHLAGSRMGPADHRITDGQAAIATRKKRDKHDFVVVQEKLDGSCVAVAKRGSEIIPLGRAGYRAWTSPYRQHRLFAQWVAENEARFDRLLADGERAVGEWLAQAHGTRYRLPHEPFVLFDIMRETKRVIYTTVIERVGDGFRTPTLLGMGEPMSIEAAMAKVEPSPHGALDPVEGVVWRVERRGEVDFLCKYVRPEKVDGCYLPELSGKDPVWNEWPGRERLLPELTQSPSG